MNRILKLFLLYAFAFSAVGVSYAEETEIYEQVYSICGRQFKAQPTSMVLGKVNARPSPEQWPSTFFIHAPGPLDGALITADGGARWQVVRAFRQIGPENRTGNVLNGYMVVFEHSPANADRSHYTMTDWVLPLQERVEKDRIYVQIVCGTGSAEDTEGGVRRMEASAFCLTPEDPQLGSSPIVYFNRDLVAMTSCGNAGINIEQNFSGWHDYRDGRIHLPDEPPNPVRAAVAICAFLAQPFPNDEQVLHRNQGRLIAEFDLEQEKVAIGEGVTVSVSFGPDALRMCEIIRLKATNGGFQRIGSDIFYRADAPGEHTLTLEAMCGFHHDGKVDFAERREIKVKVEGEEDQE